MADALDVAPLRAKLQGEVLDTPWRELSPHVARHAVLLVAPDLDLLDVAVVLAHDDVSRLQSWLETGRVGRPSDSLIEAWATEAPRFQAVIVQPWVLAQVIERRSAAPSAEA